VGRWPAAAEIFADWCLRPILLAVADVAAERARQVLPNLRLITLTVSRGHA